MAIDWDAELLGPVMGIFGEGTPADQSTWPLYTPRGLAAFRLAGAVFDAQYQEVEVTPADDTAATSKRPVLGVRDALCQSGRGWKQNDRVFIPATPSNGLAGAGQSYVVRDVQPDGHGHSKLMLMEAA